MTKEGSRVAGIKKVKDTPCAELLLSKSQERGGMQSTEDSNTCHVVIQLSKEDFSKLRLLSDCTTIPLHILCWALLKKAISRYSPAHGLDDLFFQSGGIPPANSLTNREMGILNLIVQGISNRGIASALDLSEQTVKNHVTSILRKMKVNNRTEAASMAFRNNLVQAEMSAGERPAETQERVGAIWTSRRKLR
jgi:DNA-binding CsgD family transcriptional regulator